MVDRVYLGMQDGSFRARVSRPGYDVKTATDDQLLFREDTECLYPLIAGSFSFSGAGSQSVSLSSFNLQAPPVIVLKSSDNRAPSDRTYWAQVSNNLDSITVRNEGGTRVIDYYIFNGIV